MKFEPVCRLKDIAEMLHAEFAGDEKHIISGINEIHKVEEGDITFVDHPKYYDKALNSKATTIIINKKLPCPQGKALIFSDDPFRDYVSLVKKHKPFEAAVKMISDTAQIGKGTILQPNVFVGNHVKIGKNCLIHANVSIYDHCIIGDNVIIHSNSVIGADAYYFKRRPEGYDKLESCGRVILEDNVEIGALTSVDKGVSGDTIIGKGTKIDNHVQIGHDTVIGKNVLIGSHTAIAGVTEIQDDVIIWAKVSINKDVVIGKGAVILALSGVDKSLEGAKTYWGVPVDEARKKWKEVALIRKLAEKEDKQNCL
jgi:UDP-3-O-[3-hydroxymyristoyl] glucosamine N-acyltransferase